MEKNDVDKISQLCDLLLKKFPTFISSNHIEVQERASSAYVLIQMLREQFGPTTTIVVPQTDDILGDIPVNDGLHEDTKSDEIPIAAIEIVQEMALLFAGDLNPVAPKAQRKVQIPDGLNLDEWINPPPVESSSSSDDEQTDLFVAKDGTESDRIRTVELTQEEMEKVNQLLQLLI